ncbi:hypothetical protein [Neobacillus sp. Marseille-QA0830]
MKVNKLMILLMLVGSNLVGCSLSSQITSTKNSAAAVEKKNDVTSYKQEMNDYLNSLGDAFDQFGSLNGDAAADDSIMTNPDWIEQMKDALRQMDVAITDIRATEPPEEMEDSHEEILSAMDEVEFVVINYPKIMEHYDYNLLVECKNALERSSDDIDQAIALSE